MIILNPKHNWKEQLRTVMEDLGFVTTAQGKAHIEFSYRLSKIRFSKEHNTIKCNRSTFFKYVDGEIRFYPEEYKDACEKRAEDKLQRNRNISALETKVMMFQVELEAILEKLLPTLETVFVRILKKHYQIKIKFSHKILEIWSYPDIETLLDNNLFDIGLNRFEFSNNGWGNFIPKRLPFKTLQEFLDHIQTESFQTQMVQLADSIDQDRKDSLAAEIVDLEKSIQWRKTELEKMIRDERNIVENLF